MFASIHLPPAITGALHNSEIAVTTKMLRILGLAPSDRDPLVSVFMGVFMQPADEIHRPLFGLHIDSSHILAEHADGD